MSNEGNFSYTYGILYFIFEIGMFLKIRMEYKLSNYIYSIYIIVLKLRILRKCAFLCTWFIQSSLTINAEILNNSIECCDVEKKKEFNLHNSFCSMPFILDTFFAEVKVQSDEYHHIVVKFKYVYFLVLRSFQNYFFVDENSLRKQLSAVQSFSQKISRPTWNDFSTGDVWSCSIENQMKWNGEFQATVLTKPSFWVRRIFFPVTQKYSFHRHFTVIATRSVKLKLIEEF